MSCVHDGINQREAFSSNGKLEPEQRLINHRDRAATILTVHQTNNI